MAVVLPGKFIYLCTPFTDEEQVTASLKRLPQAVVAVDKMRGIGMHATLDEARGLTSEKVCGLEHVFAFVRNPYDLIVEWFLREKPFFQMRRLAVRIGREPKLLDFVKLWTSDGENPLPYMKGGSMFYHAKEAKTVLRYEKGVEKEINGLFRKMPEVPQVAVAKPAPNPEKDHWSTYYTPETYTYVNEVFQDDFVRYGYQFLWK